MSGRRWLLPSPRLLAASAVLTAAGIAAFTGAVLVTDLTTPKHQ